MSPSSAVNDAGAGWTIEPAIPDHVRSVIVFGGGFDPPHRGHLQLPLEAREKTNSDWIVYVPASHPPLKEAPPCASDRDRLAMLRLALQNTARVSVTDVELARGGVSYTIDTLRALRGWLPDTLSFRLLIGADQAIAFHRWRSFREIIECAEPIVMLRAPTETSDELLETMRLHWSSDELERWRQRAVELRPCQANSTHIRRVISEKKDSCEELCRDLPAPVLRYIEERGLYR